MFIPEGNFVKVASGTFDSHRLEAYQYDITVLIIVLMQLYSVHDRSVRVFTPRVRCCGRLAN